MKTIGIILLVAFIIVSILLILLVVIQNEDGGGMGGLLSGAGSAAFGSHSASVLNKTTFVFVFLFFAISFGLALLNKRPSVSKDLLQTTNTVEQSTTKSNDSGNWWDTTQSSDATGTNSATTAK